jgi:shikimate dehydrogenase
MKKYAVIGDPVVHSLSPRMYNAAFESLGFEGLYLAEQVKPDDLSCFMKKLRTSEYAGISITVPHKEAVMSFCDNLSDKASKIGAVNCVYNKDGVVFGENTDWYGFIESLKEVESNLSGKKVLVLGAGGAARAIVFALNQVGAKVFLWNRTLVKAQELAQEFELQIVDSVYDCDPEILVNTTSVGLNVNDEALIDLEQFENLEIFFDLIYKETKLSLQAKLLNLKVVDAKKMLLLQAVQQFRFFTGLEAPIEVMWNSINN